MSWRTLSATAEGTGDCRGGYRSVENTVRLHNVGSHIPVLSKGRRRCRFCSTIKVERRSNLICKACNVALCKGCFEGKTVCRSNASKVYSNGYSYHTVYVRGNPPRSKRYLRCTKYVKSRCRARAVICCKGQLVNFKAPHNHPKDRCDQMVQEFVQTLKLACQSGIDSSLKKIYDDVAHSYPAAAKLKRFESVRTSMSRWKAQA